MTSTMRVLKYLVKNKHTANNPIWGLSLTSLIYSDYTIKKWSHHRRHKPIIDTMTYSFLGKICRKELIQSSYACNGNYTYYTGHYITPKGIKYLTNQGV